MVGWMGKVDVMEQATERWLVANGIEFYVDGHEKNKTGLDFFLPEFNIYVEVKRFHAARIADQMGRVENVIALQGLKAIQFLEDFVHWERLKKLRQCSSTVEPSAHNGLVSGSNPDAGTTHASSNGRTAHFDCANRGSNP